MNELKLPKKLDMPTILFSRKIPVIFDQFDDKNMGNDLLFTLEYLHGQKKELLLRITDEDNYFFLFQIKIDEEEYLKIKESQNLFIDFADFPNYLMMLLNKCKDRNKYLINFTKVDGQNDVNCIKSEQNYIQSISINNNNYVKETYTETEIIDNIDLDCISNVNFRFYKQNFNYFSSTKRTQYKKRFQPGKEANGIFSQNNNNNGVGDESNEILCNTNSSSCELYNERIIKDHKYLNQILLKIPHTSFCNSAGDGRLAGRLTIVKLKKERPFIHLVLMLFGGSEMDITSHILKELTSFKQALDSYQLNIEKLHSEHEQSQQTMASVNAKQQDLIDKKDNELFNMKRDWENQVNYLKQDYEQKLSCLEKENTDKINELNTNHMTLVNNLRSELDEKTISLIEKKESLANIKSQLQSREAEIETCSRQEKEKTKELEEIKQTLKATQKKSKDLEGRVYASEDGLKSCKKEAESLRKEVNVLTQENNNIKSKVEEYEVDLSRTTSSEKKLLADITKMTANCEKLKEEFKLEKDKNEKLEKKNNELTNDFKEKILKLKSLEDQIENLQTELDKKCGEKDVLMGKLKQCQKILKTNENVISWLSKKVESTHGNKLQKLAVKNFDENAKNPQKCMENTLTSAEDYD